MWRGRPDRRRATCMAPDCMHQVAPQVPDIAGDERDSGRRLKQIAPLHVPLPPGMPVSPSRRRCRAETCSSFRRACARCASRRCARRGRDRPRSRMNCGLRPGAGRCRFSVSDRSGTGTRHSLSGDRVSLRWPANARLMRRTPNGRATMPEWSSGCSAQVEVDAGGVDLTPGAPKQRTLLALLLLRAGEVVAQRRARRGVVGRAAAGDCPDGAVRPHLGASQAAGR